MKDKEKQKLTFEQECSLIANGEDLPQEKQIEEMAEIISDTEFVDLDGDTFCVCEFLDRVSTENIARELLKHYQPKLPEDSVVLSREEYERLTALRLFIKPREFNQKELAEKLKNINNYGIIGVDNSSIEIIPTRAEIEKETAEKILITAIQLSDMCRDFYEFQNRLVDLIEINYGVKVERKTIIPSKQFGVEIKG